MEELIGKRAQLSVGDYPVPNTSFQWFKNGVIIPNGTNSTLVISAFSENDAGSYLVRLTNRWGSASSEPVVLRTASVSYRAELVPSLLIEGEVGASYNIESSPTPDAPWSLEAQITLTNSPQRWLDLRNLTERQFYRVQKSYIINKEKVREMHRHFDRAERGGGTRLHRAPPGRTDGAALACRRRPPACG